MQVFNLYVRRMEPGIYEVTVSIGEEGSGVFPIVRSFICKGSQGVRDCARDVNLEYEAKGLKRGQVAIDSEIVDNVMGRGKTTQH